MRYHFWQFLLNQEGQPINGAEISIMIAGTSSPATVYTGEFTSETKGDAPQIITLSNGYFEFWVGDEEEVSGYPRGTKFKLEWYREGIAQGSIDYINIFPEIEGVDETDPASSVKNKLISNALTNQFITHVQHDVIFDGYPVHGMETVDVLSNDNTYNKIISNRLGKGWENHKDYIFESYSSNIVSGSPHDLQPVNTSSDDPKFNKIVSNKVIYDLLPKAGGTVTGTISMLAKIQEGYVVTDSGSTYTIDLDNGTNFEITLTDDCTLTFPTIEPGLSFTTFIKQGSGPYTITWPSSASVLFGDATEPTLPITDGKTTVVSFISNPSGTKWFGIPSNLEF